MADSSVRLSRSLNLRYLSFSRSPSFFPSFVLALHLSLSHLQLPSHFPEFRILFPLPPPVFFGMESRSRTNRAANGSTVTAIIGHSSFSRVCVYISLLNIFIYIYIYLFISHNHYFFARSTSFLFFFYLFREVRGVCRDPPRTVAGDDRVWNEFAKTRDETSRKLESEFFF